MGTLYENINVLCLKKNVTGSKMCTDIGISRNFMTELKYGRKTDASGETIKKIADYFDVSTDEVLYGEKINPTVNEDDGITENRRNLIELVKSMDEDQVDAFLAIARKAKG